jgi:Porin subfamily
MKILQNLLFGSVAGLLAVSPASAAERHANANSTANAKVCSAYGPGFRYVRGADACVKIGGWTRAQMGGSSGVNWGALNANPSNRTNGNASLGARGYITTDVRKQTQYGPVRAYLSVGASQQ